MLVVLLALAFTLGCGATEKPFDYASEPDPRRGEYVIGPADALAISVWKNPELTTELAVRPDGNITMPLIGDIRAQGFTPSQLRAEIQRRLSAFLKVEDAVVTVAVTAVNSYFVTVAGNVTSPGRYASPSYMTFAEAIALAGGPTRFSSPADCVIVRHTEAGAVKRIPVDYSSIIEGKHLEQNLVLLRGDVIYVP